MIKIVTVSCIMHKGRDQRQLALVTINTPYEALILTNQQSRKLGVFGQGLVGIPSPFHCCSDKY